MNVQYGMLGKRRREVVRKIARDLHLHCRYLKGATLETEIRRRLRLHPEFGSIWASLLMSIAVKLAVALINYWIDQKFGTPLAGGFVKGEPGA